MVAKMAGPCPWLPWLGTILDKIPKLIDPDGPRDGPSDMVLPYIINQQFLMVKSPFSWENQLFRLGHFQ